MLRLDVKFSVELKKLGLHLYTKYVDDTLNMRDAITLGLRYDMGKNELVQSSKAEGADANIPDDLQTFKLLNEIADSIDPDNKFESDTPSQHESGKCNSTLELSYGRPQLNLFKFILPSSIQARA